jgi:hypothetical protein
VLPHVSEEIDPSTDFSQFHPNTLNRAFSVHNSPSSVRRALRSKASKRRAVFLRLSDWCPPLCTTANRSVRDLESLILVMFWENGQYRDLADLATGERAIIRGQGCD